MLSNWIYLTGGNVGHFQLLCAFMYFSHHLLQIQILLELGIKYLEYTFKELLLASTPLIYFHKKKFLKNKCSFSKYAHFCINVLCY